MSLVCIQSMDLTKFQIYANSSSNSFLLLRNTAHIHPVKMTSHCYTKLRSQKLFLRWGATMRRKYEKKTIFEWIHIGFMSTLFLRDFPYSKRFFRKNSNFSRSVYGDIFSVWLLALSKKIQRDDIYSYFFRTFTDGSATRQIEYLE